MGPDFSAEVPRNRPGGSDAVQQAEAIRRRFLGREANIRSFAILIYLAAAVFLLWSVSLAVVTVVGLAQLVAGSGSAAGSKSAVGLVLAGVGGSVLGGLGAWFWRGAGDLRRLSPTGRPAGITWAVLSLINLPVGTLLGVAFLVMLLDNKGKYVLSSEYRDIVDATPEIEYKTSPILKGLLVILLMVLALAITAAMLAS